MSQDAPSLSAERINPLIRDLLEWAVALKQSLLEQYYASGNPPGTEPLPPAQVYRNLVTLRDAGSPLYWAQPAAQQELDRLSRWYGAPPAFKPPTVQPLALPSIAPMGPQAPDVPGSLSFGAGG